MRKRRSVVWKSKSTEKSVPDFFFLNRNNIPGISMFCQPAKIEFSVSFQPKFSTVDKYVKETIFHESILQHHESIIIQRNDWYDSSLTFVFIYYKWDDLHRKMDSLTWDRWDTNEWLIPGWLHQLHVPHPGEHVSLRPLRLHLPDHHHHHREVAGGLLPLLLPGGLHVLNVSFFFKKEQKSSLKFISLYCQFHLSQDY